MLKRLLMIALIGAPAIGHAGVWSYEKLPAPFIWDILDVPRESEFAVVDLTPVQRLPS